jgi:Domain of unknown function (DUF4157)/Lysine-specific metallo-endopeptidase
LFFLNAATATYTNRAKTTHSRQPNGNTSFFAGKDAVVRSTTTFIQPKLTVNQPNDPYEREADAMADKVMRMPQQNTFFPPAFKNITSPVISRKCSACEEEKKLMRKPLADTITPVIQRSGGEGITTAGATIEAGINASRGKGHTLDRGTRSFMENGFGADFSNVNIHTGSTAAQLSRQLNAQAFTVGSDIFFNEGKYSPHSESGKHLLAHELTHVVQQGGHAGRKIQRLSPGDASFQINHLPVNAGDQHDFVFFNRDSATVPASEQNKFELFITDHPAPAQINLFGFASEEGNERDNRALVTGRLQAVQTMINSYYNARPTIPRPAVTTTARPDAGHMQIDYAGFRSVEMSTGVSTVGGSTSRSSTTTRNCNVTENAAIDAARTTAINHISNAISQLSNYRSSPAAHPEMQTMLDNNFHSHSQRTIDTLLHHLRQIRRDLSNLTGNSRRRCVNPDYISCMGAGATTGRPMVTFCPMFFVDTRFSASEMTGIQLQYLLHEMGHYALFNANDWSYSNERVLRFLSTENALDNAESIAIFITEANNPGHSRYESTLTTPVPDTITACGTNQTAAEEALAWAQRWNTFAYFGVPQTYNNWRNTVIMSPHISRYFGAFNRYTLAGIYDRYVALNRIFNENITIICNPGNAPTPAQQADYDAPNNQLVLYQAFFSLSLRERIVHLYAAVTKRVPEIRDDQRRSYPLLARDYKIHFWGMPSS